MIGLYHLFAFLVPISFLPAVYQGWRHGTTTPWAMALIGLPAVVSILWVSLFLGGHWVRSFTATLWVTVAVSSTLYAVMALRSTTLRDLVSIFHPYMFCVAVIAAAWAHAEPHSLAGVSNNVEGWLWIHIASAVLTYGLLTITAVVSLGGMLKERALKHKTPGLISRRLPAVLSMESVQKRLLVFAEVVLAFGLMTGMAVQYWQTGDLIIADHKSLLSICAFAVIAILLIAEHRFGIRGKRASQALLLAYLLVTLGYPGVKFVSDILIR